MDTHQLENKVFQRGTFVSLSSFKLEAAAFAVCS